MQREPGLWIEPDHPGAAWTRRIGETGRLELYPARWPWAMMIVAALMGFLAGLGMYGDAGPNDVQRTAGIVTMLFCGVVGIPMAVRTFLRGRQPIVIDEVGIQLPSRPLIPWYEIRGTDIYINRGAHLVMIVVSAEFLSRYYGNTNPMVRTVAMLDKRVTRTPAIYLPSTLPVNKGAFAAWIAAMAGRPAESRRRP